MGNQKQRICLCISNAFPPSFPTTILACSALSHPTTVQAPVRHIPGLADRVWCCRITMQSACMIRGWLGAEGRPMMYAPIQGAEFPDGRAAAKPCSADGISALIIHAPDSISASIIHMWVHCILRKICIFIVYTVTVQHFIKFNVTELSMQAHDLFNLF